MNTGISGRLFRFGNIKIILLGLLLGAFWSLPALADDPAFALAFNGSNNYVRFDTTAGILGSGWTGPKSISVWIQPEGAAPVIPIPNTGELIVGTDQPRLFGITRGVFNGLDRLWVWNVDGATLDYIGVVYTPGEWIQVSLVHDGAMLYAFKNGLLAGSVASGPSYNPGGNTSGTLYLGGSGRSDTNLYFTGQADELSLWSTALSSQTLLDWVYSTITSAHPEWPNLRAYYQMSDGSGTTLSDQGPYQKNGALLGGMNDASWVASGAFSGAPTPTATSTGSIETPFTATATATATSTSTSTSTPTLTSQPPVTATHTPTSTASQSPTSTSTSTPTFLPTQTPTPSVTLQPSPTPTATQTSGPTSTPTQTPTPGGPTGVLQEVGFWDTPGQTHDIAIQNGYAYLADIGGGLRIISLANPTTPQEVSAFTSGYRPYGVAVQGNYAYLAAAINGLVIVDISNPAMPRFAGRLATTNYSWDVTVVGNIAYVAERWGGLRIVDVSSPANPVEMARLSTSDDALGVAVAGNYAYVAAYTAGLYVVDISNPRMPVSVSELDSEHCYGVQTSDGMVYMADGSSGLRIVDVANPVSPVYIGAFDTPGLARSLRVSNGLAYIADWINGINVADITNPAHPAAFSTYLPPGMARDVDLWAGYIYVAAYGSGLRVLGWVR